MNITLSGNSSCGHSCSQHVNYTLPQNLRHLWHCFDTTAHFKVVICPQPKVHLYNDHAILSASLFATPVRWMDSLG